MAPKAAKLQRNKPNSERRVSALRDSGASPSCAPPGVGFQSVVSSAAKADEEFFDHNLENSIKFASNSVLATHRHRAGFRLYWWFLSRRREKGRTRIGSELRQLMERMVKENPTWGAPKTALNTGNRCEWKDQEGLVGDVSGAAGLLLTAGGVEPPCVPKRISMGVFLGKTTSRPCATTLE